MILSSNMKISSRCKFVTCAMSLATLTGFISPVCAAQDRPPYASQPAPGHGASHRSSATAPEKSSQSASEKLLFQQLNESRVLAGLAPLHWDRNLAAAAREHCAVMVHHEALSHQFPGEPHLRQRASGNGASFSVLAENVAVAPAADEIHYEWMHSPPHRANILDPQLTAVGIAAMPGQKGVFAVQDFSLAVQQLTLVQQEDELRYLISAAGVHVSDDPDHTRLRDARQTCQMKDGYAGKPSSIVRFETSDLSALPPRLQSSLLTGKFRSAAVGACPPENSDEGFTHFRLAVLLYAMQ
jgi:uncharacterized protein YkwD